MHERERARKALSRIPPAARARLEDAVQVFIQTEMMGAATPELLYRAACLIEVRTGSMRIMEAAVAHLFVAVLIRRAEALRNPPPTPAPAPEPRRVHAA